MQYFKRLSLSTIFALCAALTCRTALAELVVIGSPDIKMNRLSRADLGDIYLGKHASLKTNEDLNPVDQNQSSPIYQQFYATIVDMDPDAVDRYWSGLVYSGTSNRPPMVAGDRSAIAAVENSRKAIAYVDSQSIGGQIAHVKVLYGHIPTQQHYQAAPVDLSREAKYASESSSNSAKLRAEIALLKQQQSAYQQSHAQQSVGSQSDWAALLKSTQQNPNHVVIAMNAPGAQKNLWHTMASHFMMTDQVATHQAAVAKQINWFRHNKWAVKAMLNNAEPYIAYVYQQTQQRHMPAEFALLPMIESGYVPQAHSHAGADGLWQFMASTARGKGLHIDWWYDGRRDFVSSTQAALNYLVDLHARFQSWPLAAAAYNAGAGTVSHAMSRAGGEKHFWALHLPRETEQYVPKLLALSMIVAHPARYGITLPALTTQSNVATITLHAQVDVAQAAKLAGVSRDVIKELNPGMRRWATYPDRPYQLVIPADKLQTFKVHLAALSQHQRLIWVYHRVGHDETIANLAAHYGVNPVLFKQINGCAHHALAYGQGVLVPKITQHTYADFAINNQVSQSQRLIAQGMSHSPAPVMLAQNAQSSSSASPNTLKALMQRLYN